MRVRHITHKKLDPVEYYFCSWQTQSDIEEFCSKCPWFDKQDAIQGTRVVIMRDKEFDWYEIFDILYFKRDMQKQLEIINSVLNEFLNFFNTY